MPRPAHSSVLVVEDDEDLRDLLTTLIAHEGYSVSSAEDGYQALERIGADPPSLILLDLMMPGVDGWDVLADLRDQAVDTPVVVVTAVPDAWSDIRASGASALVSKPIDMDELLRTVSALLRPQDALPAAGD